MADTTLVGFGALAEVEAADSSYIEEAGVSKKVAESVKKTFYSLSPTLVTPALGTPASGVATNLTGTAAGLTAGNVTTNANLTGHVTSTGNAAVLGSFTRAQLEAALSDLAKVGDVLEDGTIPFTGEQTFNAGLVGDVNGVAMAVGEGSGWAGAAEVSSEITKQGKLITTHLFADIAGLVVTTDESDIIGDNLAANSHAGQFALAESGQFISGKITCLEVPTTGVADIDFTVSSASNGAEDGDVDALADPVILLANTENWTLGMSKAMALLPDATSDFLYLSAGTGSGNGTYGAGQFLIELIGYEA